MSDMIVVKVCVGSSCHLKGARKLIMRFSSLLKENKELQGKVELKGSFCMERCGKGINWEMDGKPITSSTVEEAEAALLAKTAGSRKD